MSKDDSKPPATSPGSAPQALLRDLESIRDLLDADREDGAAEDEDIPILREVVQDGHGQVAAQQDHGEVQADLFDARDFAARLFDETWQEESEAILASARRTADALTARLAPGASAAAKQRLQRKLAADLPPLLEQVVGEAIDELQQRLLALLRNEVTRLMQSSLVDDPDQGAGGAANAAPSQDD